MKKKSESKVFQITPVEKYSPEEEELALCQTVLEGAENLPIMLTNQANKTVKISNKEEVGKALAVRSIK